ncbi:MAG TPA: ATP-dependent metallopeptidase FtsH/Yme1/Tma family protein, partial [Patescibacteria group bacterium]|nr:ATP-dependent metallopeptidase FtsH/Yme1/Tma family protein [Patescibacteria group bacterium]
MKKFVRGISFYLLIFIIIIMFINFVQSIESNKDRLNYTNLITMIESGKINKITVSDLGGISSVSGKTLEGNRFEGIVFTEYLTDDKVSELVSQGKLIIEIEPKNQSATWLSILPTLGLIVLLIVFFFILTQQTQGGGNRVMSFGKSKAKLHTDDKKKVTFADVAGADEEKEEMGEIVDFLKAPRKFIELGARIPKGVLLV